MKEEMDQNRMLIVRQRGYVLGIVVIALVALSIGGAAILTLSGGEADLAGQVRRQKQLQACALAGADAAIARLPDTGETPFQLDDVYQSGGGHYVTATGSTDPVAIMTGPDATQLIAAASLDGNIINKTGGQLGGVLGKGGGTLTKQVYRFVTTCSGYNNQRAEAEKIVIYGIGQ